MMADLTDTIITTSAAPADPTAPTVEGVYIYGFNNHDSSHDTIMMTEDQTGAQTVVRHCHGHGPASPGPDTFAVRQRLAEAATLALQIRDTVLRETGFTMTLGISTNVLLAKLASGLKKPGLVNILPPGPSAQALVENMPLRKIPGVGSRTMKALLPCLTQWHGETRDTATPWTCGCVRMFAFILCRTMWHHCLAATNCNHSSPP